MHALSTVTLPELSQARPSSEEFSLARTSAADLTTFEVDALEQMMAQTQARYPNQELPPGTPAMYAVEWAEMTKKYGLTTFRAGLLRAIRNRERSSFFPAPEDIHSEIRSEIRSRMERRNAEQALADVEKWKAQWLREKSEDEASGIVRGSDAVQDVTHFIRRESALVAQRAVEKAAAERPIDPDAGRKRELAEQVRARVMAGVA